MWEGETDRVASLENWAAVIETANWACGRAQAEYHPTDDASEWEPSLKTNPIDQMDSSFDGIRILRSLSANDIGPAVKPATIFGVFSSFVLFSSA